jgi:RimJ/RimL family protein N-acetyltransferase
MKMTLNAVSYARRRTSLLRDFVLQHVFSLSQSIFFEVECGQEIRLPDAPEITFRFGTRDDVAAFDLEHHGYGPAEREFGFERLGHGDSLIVGECDGEVVFYTWLSDGQIDLDQRVYVETVPGIAYSYKVFTVEAARGRHICAAYYGFIRRALLESGCSRIACRIVSGNRASILAHTRAGFRPIGYVWKLVFMGCTFFAANSQMRAWLKRFSASSEFGRRGSTARFGI